MKTGIDAWEEDKENYLLPIIRLKEVHTGSLSSIEESMFDQALFTFASFLCDYRRVLEVDDGRVRKLNIKLDNQIDSTFGMGYEIREAHEAILRMAEDYQIIMINESHHIPYHRAFVTTLLKPLSQKGFKYFAIEALEDEEINERKYPVFESGFYLREPIFAEMIRTAINSGFELVNYENRLDCIERSDDKYYCDNFRDSMQAENIIEVLRREPGAKILVYAGYSHIKESKSSSPHNRMAYYFKEITKIDPLTIDQTKMIEHSDPMFESIEYRSLTFNNSFDYPAVLAKDNKASSFSDRVDVSIFSPRTIYENGRPTFYAINKTKKKILLNAYSFHRGDLVQAFYKKEKGNRIPADQTLISDGNECLYLFDGKYELVFRRKDGKIYRNIKIKVTTR